MSELFLAEAAVLIHPDTTKFAAELQAQVTAAVRQIPPVLIPIGAAPVAGPQLAQQTSAVQQASAQLAALAAQQSATTTVTTRATAATKAKTEAQKLEARAASQVSVAQEQVLNVTSALGQAQITATRSATALANARRASAALTQQDSAATRQAVKDTLALAEAQNIQAQSALRQAQANAASGTNMSQLSRGAGAATASMLGVRGATLAATGRFLAATVAVTSLGKAIGATVDFESQIAVFGATTEATAGQLERVSEAAKQLGADITLPGVTAGSAAEAMTELSKAGLSVQDSISGARGVLQLATAAQLSNADATQLAASALNAFGLGGNQAVRVADLLANAANEAQGGIDEMGLALRQSAGVARQVGISLDDTVALLTLLAKNGLQGSDAGTALRTSMIRLINPTKEAKEVLSELNVQLRDQQGNIRPEVFAEFAESQRGLTRAQQDANAAIVFGQDAIRALAILGREGQRGLDRVTVALEKQGTAARIAGARMTGLKGEAQNLSNQLDTLGLTIGEKATPFLEGFVRVAGQGVGDVNSLAKAIGDLEGALDRLPGSEGVQGFIGDALGDAFSSPQRFLAPITRLADDKEDAEKEIGSAGADIRSAIEDAAREGVRGAETYGDQMSAAIDRAFGFAADAFARGRQALRAQALQGVQQGQGQTAGLEEEFDKILASGGDDQAQLANLRQRAAVQARIIERAGPDAQGVLLEARRAAQGRLATINQQIVSIEESIAADRTASADKARRVAEESRREADATFLQGQEDARTRQDRLIGLAQDTEGLADDIRRRQALRVLITQQIKALENSAVDEKTKQAAIKALVAERQRTTDEINRLVQTDREQRAAQREQTQEEQEAAQIALGESILALTGNKNPLLRALNAAVKDAIKERNAAKKGSVAFKEAQTEINNLLAQRKNLMEQAEKEASEGTTGGTTLVDLFNRANEILKGAGNVGFDAASLRSLPANAELKAQVQERIDIVNSPEAARAEQRARTQEQSTARLIDAIDRLTATLGGNSTTGGRDGGGGTQYARGMSSEARFFYQKQAKFMVENGLVG